jgi:hypothetical protein
VVRSRQCGDPEEVASIRLGDPLLNEKEILRQSDQSVDHCSVARLSAPSGQEFCGPLG